MRYNDDARLDTSEVTDSRGGGGGGSVAGAGLIGVLLPLLFGGRSGRFSGVLVLLVVGVLTVLLTRDGSSSSQGVLGGLGQNSNPATASNGDLGQECRTGADANSTLECVVVADINSVQDYWSAAYSSSQDR